MAWLQIGMCFLLLFTSESYATPKPVIINLSNDFIPVLDGLKNGTHEQQRSAWNTFEAKHQALFDEVIFKKGVSGWKDRREKMISNLLNRLPALDGQIRILIDAAETSLTDSIEKFKSKVPDFNGQYSIYLVPSQLTFNAKVVYWKNELVLLLAPDSMANLNEDVKDLQLILAHELFHIHHETLQPESYTMAKPFWFEGCATWASGQIISGFTDAQLLMEEKIGKRCEDSAYVKNLAQEYLEVLPLSTKSRAAILPIYTEWFSYNPSASPKDPSRKGYCLGLRVVKELAKKYSMQEFLSMDEVQYWELIRITLQEMTK